MPPQSFQLITWHRGSGIAHHRHPLSLAVIQMYQSPQLSRTRLLGIAATEEEQLKAQEERSESSDSLDDDYLLIPHMPPCRHDAEAGSSSSAPPAPQTDPALIAILERMQQDQTRQT